MVVRLKLSFSVNLALNSDWLIGMLFQDQQGNHVHHIKGHILCPFSQDVILALGVPRMCL